jgi:hypothetical protein
LSTPDGRTRTLHILHPGSNNEYKLTILSPFHTTQSLKTVITIPEVQSAIINSGNKITSSGSDENPSVPIRRILHTRQTCSKCTCNKGKITLSTQCTRKTYPTRDYISPTLKDYDRLYGWWVFLFARSSTKSMSLILNF